MGTETKVFFSNQPGAPVLNGNAGSLVDLLDAVLVNGFGAKNITGGTISNGVATLNLVAPNTAVVDSVIAVSGATPAGLNGQWRVTSISGTSVSFPVALPNGSISAAGQFNIAPLGWSIAFTGTSKRAYKSNDITSTGVFLRVDDTPTLEARVVAYETMTDVDSGQGIFPTAAQTPGGLFWGKSSVADTARDWYAIGDSKGFYIGVAGANALQQFSTWFFGDIVNYRSGDAYSAVLQGNQTSYVATNNINGSAGYSFRTLLAANHFSPRTYLGLGSSVPGTRQGAMNQNSEGYSGSNAENYSFGVFPNPTDNGLMLCKVLSYDPISRYRGEFPGVLHAIHFLNNAYPSFSRVDGTGEYLGKKLLAIREGVSAGGVAAGNFGTMFFDLYGTWR